MEIHKPHAAKSWKEFFIELGTIVLGILIALGLEQAVEAVHDRSREAQARQSIRAEIATNIGLMATRAKIENCVSRRLDEVEGLIVAFGGGKLPQGPIWLGHPPFFPTANGQYVAASQSGAVSLMSSQEQAAYASIYSQFAEQDRASGAEQTAWADLRMLEKHPAPGPALEVQLRSELQQAREARWRQEASAAQMQNALAPLEIQPNETRRFTQQSACIPLNTTRADGEKLVVKGRVGGATFDEP